MRFPRVFIAPVIAAILWIVAAAPLLPSSGGGLMPCCKGGSPCEAALQASGCCRIDAATERAVGVTAAVSRKPASLKAHLQPAPALSAWTAMQQGPPRATFALPGASPPHEVEVPLYLLNATLLL